jgi:hypothetical protein
MINEINILKNKIYTSIKFSISSTSNLIKTKTSELLTKLSSIMLNGIKKILQPITGLFGIEASKLGTSIKNIFKTTFREASRIASTTFEAMVNEFNRISGEVKTAGGVKDVSKVSTEALEVSNKTVEGLIKSESPLMKIFIRLKNKITPLIKKIEPFINTLKKIGSPILKLAIDTERGATALTKLGKVFGSVIKVLGTFTFLLDLVFVAIETVKLGMYAWKTDLYGFATALQNSWTMISVGGGSLIDTIIKIAALFDIVYKTVAHVVVAGISLILPIIAGIIGGIKILVNSTIGVIDYIIGLITPTKTSSSALAELSKWVGYLGTIIGYVIMSIALWLRPIIGLTALFVGWLINVVVWLGKVIWNITDFVMKLFGFKGGMDTVGKAVKIVYKMVKNWALDFIDTMKWGFDNFDIVLKHMVDSIINWKYGILDALSKLPFIGKHFEYTEADKEKDTKAFMKAFGISEKEYQKEMERLKKEQPEDRTTEYDLNDASPKLNDIKDIQTKTNNEIGNLSNVNNTQNNLQQKTNEKLDKIVDNTTSIKDGLKVKPTETTAIKNYDKEKDTITFDPTKTIRKYENGMVKIYDMNKKLLWEGLAQNVVEQAGKIYVGKDAYGLEGAHLTGYDYYTNGQIETIKPQEVKQIEMGKTTNEDKTTNDLLSKLDTIITIITNIEKMITDIKTKTIDVYNVLNNNISKTLNSINDNTKTMIDKLSGLKSQVETNTSDIGYLKDKISNLSTTSSNINPSQTSSNQLVKVVVESFASGEVKLTQENDNEIIQKSVPLNITGGAIYDV